MDAQQLTHEYRLSQWAPIIHTCRTSAMTVKACCQENNINEKQFSTGNAGLVKKSVHFLQNYPQPNRILLLYYLNL